LPVMPTIAKAMIDAFILILPMMATVAVQLINALANGLISNLPLILAVIVAMNIRMVQGVLLGTGALVQAGINLVAGLWSGIKQRWAALLKDFQSLVDLLPQAVKDALGIHSPSSVGIAITKNFVNSLGIGGLAAIGDVERAFSGIGSRLALATSGSMAGGGVASAVRNDNFTLQAFAPIYFQGAQTPGSVGAQVKGKRF